MKIRPQAIVGGLVFCIISLSPLHAGPKLEKSVDTFTVEMTKPQFDEALSRWLDKMKGKTLPCTAYFCDTIPPYYSSGMLRTGLFIKTNTVDNNHLKLDLTHVWARKYRKYALYRIPNVSYTLRQELGFPKDMGETIHGKSYWTFLGLTLLNSGFGMAYASYKSPFSYGNIPFTILYSLMDAALTAELFINYHNDRGFAALFLPFTKAAVCIRIIFIREHNKLSKTGYKFIVQK
jgi:hypothetical protein